jgi:MFS family permease
VAGVLRDDTRQVFFEHHLAIFHELFYFHSVLLKIKPSKGILLGIFFGRLADRKGRKFVFLLNLIPLYITTLWISAVCEFCLPPPQLPRLDPRVDMYLGYFYTTLPNPKLLWISALGYVAGGGPQMLGTMLLAMVADATPELER